MNLMLAVMLAVTQTVGSMTKVSSDSTFYDRNEGFAFFSGHVFVEDAEYLLHTDRAYVFTDGTNGLRRIVALGNVAITNNNKRAYGAKASYYRDPGLVVLYAGENGVAEVHEDTEKGEQKVLGRKIKFWTGTEQVEVIEAVLSAPSSGGDLGGLKDKIGR